MKFGLSLLRCVTVQIAGLLTLGACTSQDSPHTYPELSRIVLGDPFVDARTALAHGDRRFWGLNGFTVVVPGVPVDPFCMFKDRVRVLPDTSDAPRDGEQGRLHAIAMSYAKSYNIVILHSAPLKATDVCPTKP